MNIETNVQKIRQNLPDLLIKDIFICLLGAKIDNRSSNKFHGKCKHIHSKHYTTDTEFLNRALGSVFSSGHMAFYNQIVLV